MNSTVEPTEGSARVPRQAYPQLFWRFLRFGLLAWGGPVAQIAMIRQELVEEEHWISRERFNRVLGVYQALPGPEAQELCVYFGMQSAGRWGGFLAGLAFMLPGFLLILLLSWFYVTYGIASPVFAALFFGFKPAVAALIVRAVYRIGKHALTRRWLWAIAVAAGVASFLGADALILLVLAGMVYFLVRSRGLEFRRRRVVLGGLVAGTLALGAVLVLELLFFTATAGPAVDTTNPVRPPLLTVFLSGLRAGLLTFGGAYTSIPFLQRDAVGGGWMDNGRFLDGLALSGILPAPLIIFSTFVGYIAGGPVGAVLMTVGIFLPAFAFTLVGHGYVERLVENRFAQVSLDGITAGVVGLIAATAVDLTQAALAPKGGLDGLAVVIFAVALAILLGWKAKVSVVAAVLGGGALGLLRLLF